MIIQSLLILTTVSVTELCTPFGRDSLLVNPTMLGVSSGSRPAISTNELFASSASRARAEHTNQFIPNGVDEGSIGKTRTLSEKSFADAAHARVAALGAPSTPPITEASQLNCADFDESCRWRNVDGLFVDELDWYQGTGELDPTRVALTTATNVLPDGGYAIVAADTPQLANVKAVLVSDQIGCQAGDGEIRFMYWTSPEVQLKVCVKKVTKVYPDFDFCSAPIEKNDPGPIFINIPDQEEVPFQIYIIADHFTFNSEDLKGGFAIIDKIEYYARMCEASNAIETNSLSDAASNDVADKAVALIPLAESNDRPQSSVLPHFQLGVSKSRQPLNGIFDFSTDKKAEGTSSTGKLLSTMIKRQPIVTTTTTEVPEEHVEMADICEVIVCSFNESEPCSSMAPQSGWFISDKPVGNLLTGIRGDASFLPFNSEGGSFAYIDGPKVKSQLQTPSFYVDRPVTIVFSYYKADKTSQLRVLYKPTLSSEEVVVFEAPPMTRDSRRWFRESLPLPQASYDYIAFEASNVLANTYIGIDEMFVVDDKRKSFCLRLH